MNYQHHTDLKDRTKKFALRTIKLSEKLSNKLAEKEIAKQLIRSGMSVGANTKAAFTEKSKKDIVAKMETIIKRANECSYWLELLEEILEPNKKEIESLNKEAHELASIFTSISKKYKNNE